MAHFLDTRSPTADAYCSESGVLAARRDSGSLPNGWGAYTPPVLVKYLIIMFINEKVTQERRGLR